MLALMPTQCSFTHEAPLAGSGGPPTFDALWVSTVLGGILLSRSSFTCAKGVPGGSFS